MAEGKVIQCMSGHQGHPADKWGASLSRHQSFTWDRVLNRVSKLCEASGPKRLGKAHTAMQENLIFRLPNVQRINFSELHNESGHSDI